MKNKGLKEYVKYLWILYTKKKQNKMLKLKNASVVVLYSAWSLDVSVCFSIFSFTVILLWVFVFWGGTWGGYWERREWFLVLAMIYCHKGWRKEKAYIVYYIKEKLLYLHDSLYFLRDKYIVLYNEWTYNENNFRGWYTVLSSTFDLNT